MFNNEISIRSICQYIDVISRNQIPQKDLKFVYRGQNQFYENKTSSTLVRRYVSSSATRRLCSQNGSFPTKKDIYLYSQSLLTQVESKGYSIKNGRKLLTLEIFAELQHHGCATFLIDFTFNPLVALYFACKGRKDDDGSIFVFNINSSNVKDANDYNNLYETDSYDNVLINFFDEIDDTIFYWIPSDLNKRIPSQNSIFLFGKQFLNKHDFDQIILVKAENKNEILNDLDQIYNINETTLFNDFTGFALANNVCSEIRYLNTLDNKNNEDKRLLVNLCKEISNIEKNSSLIHAIGREEISIMYFNYSRMIANNDKDKALEIISKALFYNNKNPKYWNYKANLEIDLSKYEEAAKSFSEAIKIDDKYSPTFNNRGIYYAEVKKNFILAIEDFTNAIKLNPKRYEHYIHRAFCYTEIQDYDKAIDDYNSAIDIEPNNSIFYNNRASMFLQKNDKQNALKDYLYAIDLEPKQCYYHYSVGNIYFNDKKINLAIRYFNNVLECDSTFVDCYYFLAMCQFEKKKYKLAKQYIDRFIETKPLEKAIIFRKKIEDKLYTATEKPRAV